ncbi:MAG: hypothetical protein FJ255_10655 [Phycisphaerae bacterium]|nr:hypothetical protein [Phycisphaerae bacterium]
MTSALLPIDAAGMATAAAIAAVAYFALVGPTLDRAREGRAASAELAGRLEEVGRLKGELAAAERRARESRMRVEQAPRILRPIDAMNARLAELTTLAEECSLSIEAMAPGVAARQERLIRVPVKMGGRGRYADCVRFLDLLHERFQDVDVDGFRMMTLGEETGGSASFSIDCAWLAAREAAHEASAPPKG